MTRGRERLHAIVHGYVQGVGFRAFVAREARRFRLDGTVCNRPDGTVEVVAEGERPELEAFLRLLEQGPSEAEVQRVEAHWSAAHGEQGGFQIIF